jgi:hypothetical protein
MFRGFVVIEVVMNRAYFRTFRRSALLFLRQALSSHNSRTESYPFAASL